MQKECDKLSAAQRGGRGGAVDTAEWEARFAAVKALMPEHKARKAEETELVAELDGVRGELAELQVRTYVTRAAALVAVSPALQTSVRSHNY